MEDELQYITNNGYALILVQVGTGETGEKNINKIMNFCEKIEVEK